MEGAGLTACRTGSSVFPLETSLQGQSSPLLPCKARTFFRRPTKGLQVLKQLLLLFGSSQAQVPGLCGEGDDHDGEGDDHGGEGSAP